MPDIEYYANKRADLMISFGLKLFFLITTPKCAVRHRYVHIKNPICKHQII